MLEIMMPANVDRFRSSLIISLVVANSSSIIFLFCYLFNYSNFIFMPISVISLGILMWLTIPIFLASVASRYQSA